MFENHLPAFRGIVLLNNVSVVTPDNILTNASVLVREGRFDAILEAGASELTDSDRYDSAITIDAQGMFMLPGIVDLHSDKLVSEMTPRPGADLPSEIALQEIEQKFLACGVTTLFHAISVGYLSSEKASRSTRNRIDMCYDTFQFARNNALARTFVHLRYEIQGHDLDKVYKAVDDGIVSLLSVMDHRPGHGQMSKERYLANLVKRGFSDEMALAKYEEMHNEKVMDREAIRALVDHAHAAKLFVASHDDPSEERVVEMREMGINISEFPLTLAAAEKAIELGMLTIGGSCNSLRGGSLSGNLCVNAALQQNLLTALCSDYYPPALLHSVFQLPKNSSMTLPEAVKLITLGPASIVSMDSQVGSIEPGKLADFILVDASGNFPKVLQTWVAGNVVHQSNQRKLESRSKSPFPIHAPMLDPA